MKLLTFLGTTDYKETSYTWGDQRRTTRYCPAAVAHFFQPEATLVVVTKDAEAKHFEALADEIAAISHPVPVPIPDGHSEADLWAIFDALTGHVVEEDRLVVDITNGFRSLPFLSFLAVAYLRVAKRTLVEGVYYGGALGVNPDGSTPIFDLTPFVTLLDWTSATDQFLATGNAQQLVHLLCNAHRLPWLRQDRPGRSELPTQLQTVAGKLETLSHALRLARPEDVMAAAASLHSQLTTVKPEVERWAKPFGLLLERTNRDYSALAMEGEPRAADQMRASLRVQREMVGWYVTRRQYVQAIILAREWLVSYAAFRLGWDVIDDRDIVETALYAGADAQNKGKDYPAVLKPLPQVRGLIELWNQVPDLRNDIAHAGIREHPRPVNSIIKAASLLSDQLAAFSLE